MNEKGTFFCVSNRIFNYGLKPRDIAVYCCICRHINQKTGVAFPSRKIIAKECGIGKVDTVDKALAVLCNKGLIKKKHQYRPDKVFRSNIYAVSQIGDTVPSEKGC